MKSDLPPLLNHPVPPKVLKQILENAALMERLSDRVYELLKDEMRQQRERKQGYGRRF